MLLNYIILNYMNLDFNIILNKSFFYQKKDYLMVFVKELDQT